MKNYIHDEMKNCQQEEASKCIKKTVDTQESSRVMRNVQRKMRKRLIGNKKLLEKCQNDQFKK